MAKVHWGPKKLETFPTATVPGTLHDVDFLLKDSQRFADSGGWAWGAFKYAAASGKFTPATTADMPPQGNDAKCGLGCHTIVKGRDYVFTGLREAVNVNRPDPKGPRCFSPPSCCRAPVAVQHDSPGLQPF